VLANHAEVVMHDLAAGQDSSCSHAHAACCSVRGLAVQGRPCNMLKSNCRAPPLAAHTDPCNICGGCAGLLVELERLMLTSGTASVSMNTFLDSAPEFQAAVGAASALEAMSSRLYNDDVSMQF
jgi:hypothetical protein